VTADGKAVDGSKGTVMQPDIHVFAPPITKEIEDKLKQLREEISKEKVYKDNAAMRHYCDQTYGPALPPSLAVPRPSLSAADSTSSPLPCAQYAVPVPSRTRRQC
jgi:hypothetical protein